MSRPLQPRRSPLLVWLGLCCLLLTACASGAGLFGADTPDLPSKRSSAEEVEAQLERAAAELANGQLQDASERCLRLRQVRNLPSPLRERSEVLLEQATVQRVELAQRSRDLRSPSASRLPRRSRAIATVARASLLLAEGRPYRAFSEIRDLEAAHPGHHLQNEAADVVYQAGLTLAQAKPAWIFLFSKRAQAPGVFDYLVLQHPSYSGCDHAYYLLASLHSEDRDIELAIDRLSDLLLYHPTSPYAREAELLIPTLRLSDHLRIDHDYAGLVMTERELTSWLGRVGSADENELTQRARDALLETRRRILAADLENAQFYRTIKRPEGAELHADRARRLAVLIDDQDAIRQADALLAWAGRDDVETSLPPEFRQTEPAEDKSEARDVTVPTENQVGVGS
jgi:hypothetical protein